MPTCFFIGHWDTPESLLPALSAEVERHITEYGVTEFLVGHYGAFDRLAARAVREAKVRHPAVTLLMLLPYHPAQRPVQLPEGFDGSLYLQGMEAVPRRWAIVQSNRQAVDRCDFLIVDAVEKKYKLLFNLCGEGSPHRPQSGLASDFIVSTQALPHSGSAAV